MGKIIAFSNQKGGVGKTTTAINMAAYLAHSGKKVLLADMDPQGNSSTGNGIEKGELEKTIYDLLLGRATANDVIFGTAVENLHILPCNMDLAAAEVELVNMEDREHVLKRALTPIRNFYDYILIDCPPSLGLLTINALTACDEVIIPIQCEFFALEGLSQLIYTIKLVRQRLNPQITVSGVVITMYDGRSLMSRQVAGEINRYFANKVFSTVVPRNVKLCEAPSYGVPIVLHAPRSNGAIAYEKITKEYLRREESNNG